MKKDKLNEKMRVRECFRKFAFDYYMLTKSMEELLRNKVIKDGEEWEDFRKDQEHSDFEKWEKTNTLLDSDEFVTLDVELKYLAEKVKSVALAHKRLETAYADLEK